MECGTFANRGDVLDILYGASQASRAADEVIEYGTRTSDIVQVFGRRHDEPFHALWRPASENLHKSRSERIYSINSST